MQTFFFIAFPYIALIVAIGVGLYRYFSHRFTYSSLSSQLLENRHLFWGSVSWHYGITLILVAHILPWLFPRAAAAVLGDPTRLFVLELAGLALGFYCVFGIIVLIARRQPNSSIARTKSRTCTMRGSNSTVAVLVARFTLTRTTPGVLVRVRSMVRAQAAQVMPETGRSTRSGTEVFMLGHRSPVAGPRWPGPRASPHPRHIPRWHRHSPGPPWPWPRRAWPGVSAPRCASNCRKSFR